MQTKRSQKVLSLILCFVLLAALALLTNGCDKKTDAGQPVAEKEFTFTVVDAEGNETVTQVATKAETVGEALVEKGYIDGENSTYGLYVKTVNGITLDYDKDGKYWAFYVNGDYAPQGIDQTPVEEGASYALKAE